MVSEEEREKKEKNLQRGGAKPGEWDVTDTG